MLEAHFKGVALCTIEPLEQAEFHAGLLTSARDRLRGYPAPSGPWTGYQLRLSSKTQSYTLSVPCHLWPGAEQRQWHGKIKMDFGRQSAYSAIR